MPNTFGGYSLFDPRLCREHRRRFLRDMIPQLEYANGLWCPGGKAPARAWLLMRRADYDRIDPYATNLELSFEDVEGNGGKITLKGLTVVQARCVTRGISSDPDAVYLVEATDKRGILANKWFAYPTLSQYNAVSPAYPSQFYSGTLHAGVPFTWDYLVSDLWNQMTTFLGAYPGLPSAPTGTPENYVFPGVSAWGALNHVLDHLGMAVSVDLTKASPYGIVFLGQADSTFSALQASSIGVLEDDLEYQDVGSGRVPGQVVVLFHRRNEFYGTEETIRRDSFQWQTTPLYSVTVPAPAEFSSAVGTAYLWDDFSVRFDIDGAPLPADATTANTIAAERVIQYYALIHSANFLRQTYTGLVPFATGSLCDGVCWRMDHRFPELAFRTEAIRGYVFPEAEW